MILFSRNFYWSSLARYTLHLVQIIPENICSDCSSLIRLFFELGFFSFVSKFSQIVQYRSRWNNPFLMLFLVYSFLWYVSSPALKLFHRNVVGMVHLQYDFWAVLSDTNICLPSLTYSKRALVRMIHLLCGLVHSFCTETPLQNDQISFIAICIDCLLFLTRLFILVGLWVCFHGRKRIECDLYQRYSYLRWHRTYTQYWGIIRN